MPTYSTPVGLANTRMPSTSYLGDTLMEQVAASLAMRMGNLDIESDDTMDQSPGSLDE